MSPWAQLCVNAVGGLLRLDLELADKGGAESSRVSQTGKRPKVCRRDRSSASQPTRVGQDRSWPLSNGGYILARRSTRTVSLDSCVRWAPIHRTTSCRMGERALRSRTTVNVVSSTATGPLTTM